VAAGFTPIERLVAAMLAHGQDDDTAVLMICAG